MSPVSVMKMLKSVIRLEGLVSIGEYWRPWGELVGSLVDHTDQAKLMFRRRIRMRESLLQQEFKLDSRLKLRQCNRFNVIHCSGDPGISLFWRYCFNLILKLQSCFKAWASLCFLTILLEGAQSEGGDENEGRKQSGEGGEN